MTMLWHRICCFSPVAAEPRRYRRAGTLAGIALAFLLGGTLNAAANETETGDAEEAPASVMNELAETKLIADGPATMDPSAVISPARVFAHTAQLKYLRAAAPANRPMFPVDMPAPFALRAPSLMMVPPITRDAAMSAAVPRANKSQLTPAKAKAARRTHLSLAPSAAEIRREIAARNGGPEPIVTTQPEKQSLGTRLEQKATATPTQNSRWPTHVDYSTGPSGPAGANTAGDRKGTMIEVTGPQQGVLRNRW